MKKKPKCKLIGTNGNVFTLYGKVREALREAGLYKEREEFSSRLFKCESYDEALALMCEYVDIY